MARRPPPLPLRPGLNTRERLRRIRDRHERAEKRFDPARPPERRTRPHHFSVNRTRPRLKRNAFVGNTTTLHAQPYIGAGGFYMKSTEDWEQGYQQGLKRGVEEYEIQFIDGPSYLAELFQALGVDQSMVELWFDTIQDLPEGEAVAYYAASVYGTPQDELRQMIEDGEQPDLILYSGNLREVAQEMIDEMDHATLVQRAMDGLFDWEAYGNYTENSIGTGADEQSYEAWQSLVDEKDGDLGDAAWELMKDYWGTDSHGGVAKSFYQDFDEGQLRDFMNVEQLATDLDIEGYEISFGGDDYVFIP